VEVALSGSYRKTQSEIKGLGELLPNRTLKQSLQESEEHCH